MSAKASTDLDCCAVVELRQYTLKPQQRDVLINLFDRYFVESQEALGMTVIGQFRDRRDANRFVWLRGFSDMESRRKGLQAFYGGPVWAAHKTEANDTMLDSDNVLLLRPARPDLAFRLNLAQGKSAASAIGTTTVLAGVYQISRPVDAEFVSQFEKNIVPTLRANHVRLEGIFVTESAPNTFPRLPVREGEHILVWFGLVQGLEVTPAWLDKLASLTTLVGLTASILELDPTSRSVLGNGPEASRATKHDFDFLFGYWKIHNRYLKERLSHSTEWAEFDARSEVAPLLDGFGHLDRFSAIRDGAPFEGITLRLFDPTTGQWSIHWADTTRAHTLLPPMVGRFNNRVGEFFGHETVNGKTVRCKFLWTQPAINRAQWEQAFSDDGGKTWETNWIMTFTRP